MDSSTHTPPFKRLFNINKTLSLRERAGNFGSLLSLFPVNTSLDVDRASRLLSMGQVVGMPTETVYGIAANIESEKALRSIFEIKERPFFDPLIVHISNIEMIARVTDTWSELCHKLAEAFWPGPLTIVTEKHRDLNPLITSGLNTVAVRMPGHPVALALISRLGSPVAAPSANKFGKTSPTTRAHVLESFPDLFVLEGGGAEIGLESTVVRVSGDQITILRPGFVTLEELRQVTQNVDVQSSVHAPGHLENHYQPELPLVVLKNLNFLNEALAKLQLSPEAKSLNIELDDDAFLAARTLYQKLRSGSRSEADYLVCHWKPHWQGGLWDAIWDRLQKASSQVG